MINVRIPFNYKARPYQKPFWRAMQMQGYKRACLVWHRRAGKDKSVLNFTVDQALNERVGVYYHCLPSYNQGRKVLWDGIDKDGFKMLDHIPDDVIAKKNNTEMKVELVNGSIWQVIGADNYDAVMGSNPVGIVLSEYSVSDRYPMAWDYFRPILAENGGWAIFIFTPRGRNHAFQIYQMALQNEGWFAELLTADDTGAITRQDIDEERKAGMGEDMIRQEFYCDFLVSTENVLIPYALIEGALNRKASYAQAPKLAGLDVARFGDDRTALVVRQGGNVAHIETWRNLDTMQTSARVQDLYKARVFQAIAVDAIGVGAGVADILSSWGVPVVAVNVAESASNDDRFSRLRDELWWSLRDWFNEGTCSIPPHPHRDKLVAEIQDIRYDYNPTGKVIIEPKDQMKERMGFSPDIADALCLTFDRRLVWQAERPSIWDEVRQLRNDDDYDPLYRRTA